MDMNRRDMLKLLAVSGMASAVSAWVGMLSSTIRTGNNHELPLYLLVNAPGLQAEFLAGVGAGQFDSGIQSPLLTVCGKPDVSFVDELEQRLRERPARFVGLLDDANAAIVVGLAQGGGVKLHWLGQHQMNGSGTRHTIQQAVQGCRPLAAHLHATETSYSRGNWVKSLGYTLTQLNDASMATVDSLSVNQLHAADCGSLVSFSFDAQGYASHG